MIMVKSYPSWSSWLSLWSGLSWWSASKSNHQGWAATPSVVWLFSVELEGCLAQVGRWAWFWFWIYHLKRWVGVVSGTSGDSPTLKAGSRGMSPILFFLSRNWPRDAGRDCTNWGDNPWPSTLLPAFNIIMIIILYIEQGEGDIARKSMGIYTYVRSLQEVFTKLEKCRKPVNDKKIMMTTSQHPTYKIHLSGLNLNAGFNTKKLFIMMIMRDFRDHTGINPRVWALEPP